MKIWLFVLGGLGALFLTALAVPSEAALKSLSGWLDVLGVSAAADFLNSRVPPQPAPSNIEGWTFVVGGPLGAAIVAIVVAAFVWVLVGVFGKTAADTRTIYLTEEPTKRSIKRGRKSPARS